jgi:hypothetical protein
MPAMSDYMKNKSSRAFAANVAAYKRLLRMAVKARVGTANVCVFFASQGVFCLGAPPSCLVPLLFSPRAFLKPVLSLLMTSGHKTNRGFAVTFH